MEPVSPDTARIPLTPNNLNHNSQDVEERTTDTADRTLSMSTEKSTTPLTQNISIQGPKLTRKQRRRRKYKNKRKEKLRAPSNATPGRQPSTTELTKRLDAVTGPLSSYSGCCLCQFYVEWMNLLQSLSNTKYFKTEKLTIQSGLLKTGEPWSFNRYKNLALYSQLMFDKADLLDNLSITGSKRSQAFNEIYAYISETRNIIQNFKAMPADAKEKLLQMLQLFETTFREQPDLLFRSGKRDNFNVQTGEASPTQFSRIFLILESLLLSTDGHDALMEYHAPFKNKKVRTKASEIEENSIKALKNYLKQVKKFEESPNAVNTYNLYMATNAVHESFSTPITELFNLATKNKCTEDPRLGEMIGFLRGTSVFLTHACRLVDPALFSSILKHKLVEEENIESAHQYLLTESKQIESAIDNLESFPELPVTSRLQFIEVRSKLTNGIEMLSDATGRAERFMLIYHNFFFQHQVSETLAAVLKTEMNDQDLNWKLFASLNQFVALHGKMSNILDHHLRDPVVRWGETHKDLLTQQSQKRKGDKCEQANKRNSRGKNARKRRVKKGKMRRKEQREKGQNTAPAHQGKAKQQASTGAAPAPATSRDLIPAPSEIMLSASPLSRVERKAEEQSEPANATDLLDNLVQSAKNIQPGHLLGNREDKQCTQVRKFGQRALLYAGRALQITLLDGGKDSFDYEQSVRVVDGCRRLLEAALTLAVARYPIYQGDEHVIVAQTDPNTYLPHWGHNPEISARTLVNAPQAVPESVRKALLDQSGLVAELAYANQLLHYPGTARHERYATLETNRRLCDLLHKLQRGEGGEELLNSYLAPTLLLVRALIDEQWTEEMQYSIEQVGVDGISDNPEGEETRENNFPDTLGVEDAAEVSEQRDSLSHVKSIDDAKHALKLILELLNATTYTPVDRHNIVGQHRQDRRNNHLETARVHLLRLQTNLERTRETGTHPEDVRQALHETVRALRSVHLAALVNLPLFSEGVHLLDTQNGQNSTLSYSSDIPMLNRHLRQAEIAPDSRIDQVPDCETQLSWLRNAHSQLNNPAYQLYNKTNPSAFAKALIQLDKDTKERLRLKKTDDDFQLGNDTATAGYLRQAIQERSEAVRATFLFPAIEALYKTMTFGFAT